ncbi:MAG: hypothetical protein RJB39_66 [Candidatus Parcubacteria bacterium]|jgi:hypothetical protein
MKLYRGITSKDYIEHSEEFNDRFKDGWRKILNHRGKDLAYPEKLNDIIIDLHKIQSLTRQYFTDNKKITQQYIKGQGGVIIEIDVPVEDILDNFIIEFQNYSTRKDRFEITYLITSKDLLKNKDKWKMRVIK